MGVSRPRIRVLYFHPPSRKRFTLRTCPRRVLVSPGSVLPSTADSSPPPRAPLPAHLSGDSKRNGKIRRSRRTRYQAAAGEIWRVLEISMEKWYTSISLWCLLFIILHRIKNLSTLFFKADFFFRLKSFPAFQFCYKCDNKRQNLPEQRCWCKLSLYVFKYYVLDMTIPNPLS